MIVLNYMKSIFFDINWTRFPYHRLLSSLTCNTEALESGSKEEIKVLFIVLVYRSSCVKTELKEQIFMQYWLCDRITSIVFVGSSRPA